MDSVGVKDGKDTSELMSVNDFVGLFDKKEGKSDGGPGVDYEKVVKTYFKRKGGKGLRAGLKKALGGKVYQVD